ncbi:RICIN domain-containing protein [Micromonospora sp. NPDC049559]|uniref:RICIN domain-containing protein n=1 Tax=Micromonospora sp. NPDC049559 TaxID=3155923 RepID=UPI00344645F8
MPASERKPVASPAQAATHYWVWNYKSGYCMSVEGGGSTANGAEIIQWSCNGGPEQNWYEDNGYLVNGKSDVVSVSGGGSTAEGAKLVQWGKNGGSEQGWHFDAKFIDA